MLTWLGSLVRKDNDDECLMQRFQQIIPAVSESSGAYRSHLGTAPHSPHPLSNDEQDIVRTIRERTEEHNANNVTRTDAYLDYYRRHPEIHWALLAHMVSRNGGWSMTDVRGSLLRPILSEQKARALFHMFERSNWLIFHDAYPQLLLYAEAIRQGKPLFHLLPFFGVSRFMPPVWQHFWKERDSSLLTEALIINEQQYIERRVVKHPHFKRTVLHTAVFKLQTAFDFNQVVFPVAGESSHPRLVGRTMHNFANITHRIRTGRLLYYMLFHPRFHERITAWVKHHPHTGSRADYWPERFTADASALNEKVYSPHLRDAWRNVVHRPAEDADWYKHLSSLSVVEPVNVPSERRFYVTDVYERSYHRLHFFSFVARATQRVVQQLK